MNTFNFDPLKIFSSKTFIPVSNMNAFNFDHLKLFSSKRFIPVSNMIAFIYAYMNAFNFDGTQTMNPLKRSGLEAKHTVGILSFVDSSIFIHFYLS